MITPQLVVRIFQHKSYYLSSLIIILNCWGIIIRYEIIFKSSADISAKYSQLPNHIKIQVSHGIIDRLRQEAVFINVIAFTIFFGILAIKNIPSFMSIRTKNKCRFYLIHFVIWYHPKVNVFWQTINHLLISTFKKHTFVNICNWM